MKSLAVLPPQTASAWRKVRSIIPQSAYLGGGTAIALHLDHRTSVDLDFFFDERAELDLLTTSLRELGDLEIQLRDEVTLNCQFDGTRLQFLDVSQSQTSVEPLTELEGINIASLGDLAALELVAVVGRPALRDYYDLIAIEIDGNRRIEDCLGVAIDRFNPPSSDQMIRGILRALVYQDDVPDDPMIPLEQTEINTYLSRRVATIVAHLDRSGTVPIPVTSSEWGRRQTHCSHKGKKGRCRFLAVKNLCPLHFIG